MNFGMGLHIAIVVDVFTSGGRLIKNSLLEVPISFYFILSPRLQTQ